MSDKKKKQDLVKVQEAHGLTLEQAMAHPVVQQMNKKLEEMRQVIEGLPEAIGKSVV